MAGFLSGIFKNQDEFEIRISNAQAEIGRQNAIRDAAYLELGKRIAAQGGTDQFPDIQSQLDGAAAAISAEEEKIRIAGEEKAAKEKAEAEALAARTCKNPACNYVNAPGTVFCLRCGVKIGEFAPPPPQYQPQYQAQYQPQPPQQPQYQAAAPAPAAGASCAVCGAANDRNDKFCKRCGANLGAAPAPATPEAPAAPESRKTFCRTCGSEIPDGARFCSICGSPRQ